jgi:Raf kinase inhibitor-like YbhB/YbcL family protein
MKVLSSAFDLGQSIPMKYTADGQGLSPPLEWQGTPPTAESVVVIVEDADSPTPHPLVHAIVVNLDVRDHSLIEGALNSPEHEGIGLRTGRNSFLSHAWLPPDPPPGHGVHRYLFQVFALRSGAVFSESPGRQELFDAIAAYAVGAGCTLGTYERAERVRAAQPESSEQESMGVPSALAPA